MDRVILACTDPAAADWAEEEARLRGLPLTATDGVPADLDGAKLVVMGVRRACERSDERWGTWGTTPIPRPLVLVPDDLAPVRRPGRVLLGVDARDPAGAVIDFAFDCARVRGARLHVVHAWALPPRAAELPFGIPEEDRGAWEDEEVQVLADALRPWREKYREVDVLEDVLLFPPAEALLHHCASAALVVLGRRPGTAWGHVSRVLLRESPCPVAVVPA
jgi:nucleotide-binding universal stress UspA family protein